MRKLKILFIVLLSIIIGALIFIIGIYETKDNKNTQFFSLAKELEKQQIQK